MYLPFMKIQLARCTLARPTSLGIKLRLAELLERWCFVMAALQALSVCV
jgi:hypothetical protein